MRRHLVAAIATLVAFSVPMFGGIANAAPPKRVTIAINSGPTAASGGATNQPNATFVFTPNPTNATTTCSFDGARATACTSPLSFNGLKIGPHSLRVNGAASGYKSGSATWTWTIDQTPPPAPTVSKPANPNNLSSVPLTLTSIALDLKNFTCSLDGAVATTCLSTYNAPVSTDGPHNVTVRAVDKAGNVSPPTTVAWLRDTVLNKPNVNSGPPSLTTATSATFTYSSDEQGVAFACKLDAGAFTTCVGGSISYSALSSSNPGVVHTFQVRATDAAGNIAVSDVYSWTVKNAVAISVAWSNPSGLPAAVTKVTTASLDFTTSGSPTITCTLDGSPIASCSSPVTASVAEGTHTVVVTASGGLPLQIVNLTYRWVVDTTAPQAPTINGPSGTVATTDATFIVTPAAGGDTVACTVDALGAACSSTLSLTGLAEGAHQLIAIAIDAAGNTSQATRNWSVDTVGPVATVTPATTLTAASKVTFNEDTGGVTADSVSLQLFDGTPMATSMACKNAAQAMVDCSGTAISTVLLTPTKFLMPGQSYQVVVNPGLSATVVDALDNVAAPVTQTFRAQLVQQENSPAAVYSWRSVKTSKAAGGSYLVERRKGASIRFAFSGTSIGWVTAKGPTFGVADVLVDGVRKATVNNYSRRTGYKVVRTVKGLKPGEHTVTVVAKGKKGSKAAKDTLVAVDGFKLGKTLNAKPVVTASWQRVKTKPASGGAYAIAGLKTQSVSFKFRGTGVSWRTVTGRAFGNVTVIVDGVKTATVKNFSTTTKFKTNVISGLADGVHTLKLVVTGTKDKRATAASFGIDQWTVA